MRGVAVEPGPLEQDIAAILGIEGAPPSRRRRGVAVRILMPAALLIMSASFAATAWLRSGAPVRSETIAAGASVPQASRRLPVDPPIPARERQLAVLEPAAPEPIPKLVSPRRPDRHDIARRRDEGVPSISRPVAPPDRRQETRPAGPAEIRTASLPVEAAEPPVGSGDALSAGRPNGAATAPAARTDLALAGDPGDPGGAPAPPAVAAPDPPGASGPRSASKVRVERSIDAIRLLRRQ